MTGLLAPLTLTGCDGFLEDLPWSEEPRALVTLSPLTSRSVVFAREPVFVTSWPVSPREGRPLAMMAHRERSLEATVHAVTLATPDGHEIPVDPGVARIRVDGHGPAVRILTQVVEDHRYTTSLLTSENLVDWDEEIPVPEIDRGVACIGSEVAVADQYEQQVKVWRVGDGGETSALTSLDVPRDTTWTLHGVTAQGETIVILLEVTQPDEEGVFSTVTSSDAGSSWGSPEPLATTGTDTTADEIRAVGEGFVVIGDHDIAAEWTDEDRSFRRPAAWSSADGQSFHLEDVVLPTFGRDNWTSERRGDLSADTPMDFMDGSRGSAVLGPGDGSLHLALYFGDDARVLSRSSEGTWSASSRGPGASHMIDSALADPSGMILRHFREFQVLTDDDVSPRSGLACAAQRALSVARGESGDLVGLVDGSYDIVESSLESWNSYTQFATSAVRIEEDSIDVAVGLPSGVGEWRSARAFTSDTGVTVLTGRHVPDDDAETLHLAVAVRIEDEWVLPEGLDQDRLAATGGTSMVGDVLHLPFSINEESGETTPMLVPQVVSSEDGVSWELHGTVDSAALRDAGWGNGATLERVGTGDGDTLIGVGAVTDEDGNSHAATFVAAGEGWEVREIAEAPRNSRCEDAYEVDGTLVGVYSWAGRTVHLSVTADGSTTEIYRSTDRERRDAAIDLGGGALIAGGWIDVPAPEGDQEEVTQGEVGIGACVWASLDAGETWHATLLPGQSGRFPDVRLLREGDAVIVIVDDVDGPRGYRILDARADVLGEDEE